VEVEGSIKDREGRHLLKIRFKNRADASASIALGLFAISKALSRITPLTNS
jgi:hypothetical protein